MKITYFTYDKLKFSYTEKELEDVINDILQDYDEDSFSFKSLCDSLMNKAQNSGKIVKKHDTVYLSSDLDEHEYDRISVLLWRKIWNHELCLSFRTTESQGRDYKFIKIKQNEEKC